MDNLKKVSQLNLFKLGIIHKTYPSHSGLTEKFETKCSKSLLNSLLIKNILLILIKSRLFKQSCFNDLSILRKNLQRISFPVFSVSRWQSRNWQHILPRLSNLAEQTLGGFKSFPASEISIPVSPSSA